MGDSPLYRSIHNACCHGVVGYARCSACDLVDPREFTDDQLIAELQRRHPNRAGMLQSLTDEELRDEMRRRWAGSGPTCKHGSPEGAICTPCNLGLVKDDELRAECERRGIPTDAATSLLMDVRRTGDRIAAVTAERDEWKRRAEEAEKERYDEVEVVDHAACLTIAEGGPLDGFTPTRPSHRAVIALRRRAEAAEAECARRKSTVDAKNEMLADLREKLRSRDDEAKNLVRKHFRDEGGPGIAAKPAPADAHYVDPWDLLADDAP